MMRWLATHVANTLQSFYEGNRVSETWGTPSVSTQTFDTLRHQGFWAAWDYLMRRLREVGRPDFSPARKCAALLCGIVVVALANTLLRQEKKPITRREARLFSPGTPKSLVTLYVLGAALLLAANDGPSDPPEPGENWGESGGSAQRIQHADGSWGYHYPGSDESTDYRAYGQVDGGDGQRDIHDTDAFDEWDERDR